MVFYPGSSIKLALTLSILSNATANAAPNVSTTNATNVFESWEKLPASVEINWVPCNGKFTCAKLEVPLDYEDPSIGTTAIAFMKLAAETQPAEDLLLNFGGPDGSGVGILEASTAVLRKTFGAGYNLVGFDPRGVNNSGPSLDCFPNDPESRKLFNNEFFRPVSDESDQSAAIQFYLADAWGKWCNGIIGGPNGTAKYANTPAVARDMLRYAEKQASANGKNVSESKVYFYGVSYGTLLGTTFASLFPDRIGRMILDGVADAQDYYSGAWTTYLFQADEAARTFFTSCFNAGPKNCSFAGNASSPADIETRFNTVLRHLKDNPIPIHDPSVAPYPILATYADLKRLIFTATYSPLTIFPLLSQVLVNVENRNGSLLANAAGLNHVDKTSRIPSYDEYGAGTVIHCVDSANRTNYTTLEEYKAHARQLINDNSYTGDANTEIAVSCRSFDVLPPPSGLFTGRPSANHTSFPILFVGNTVDPVTPIRDAYKTSDLFPGSVVLRQDSVGHGTISSVSQCVYDAFNRYLVNGTLPDVNTTCAVDVVAFRDRGVVTLYGSS